MGIMKRKDAIKAAKNGMFNQVLKRMLIELSSLLPNQICELQPPMEKDLEVPALSMKKRLSIFLFSICLLKCHVLGGFHHPTKLHSSTWHQVDFQNPFILF